MANIIVILIIGVILILAIRSVWKNHKSGGCSSCGNKCSCGHCNGCGSSEHKK
ncbi:MAG: FeoB-associated Cys-rich membrane protein [Oscillospiraceae bacterium]|nr:FeoB-associated Cys-rich membrane protein [Oscillospiraceae bacterium]